VGSEEITLGDFSHLSTRARFIALMPQRDFLEFLVERAQVFPTFSIRMNTEVVEPIERSGRIIGVRAKTESGPLEVRADLVIAADGRHSRLRDACGLHPRAIGSPIDVLWFRLPRRGSDPGDSLGWVKPGRMMVLLDRGDYWQIAYLIPKGAHDWLMAMGIDAFRRAVAETVPFLADRVDDLRGFDDVKLLVVTIDRLKRWWRSGLLFIGDAAHAMSPIGGIGINLAIQDAVAAANILGGPLARGEPIELLLARVQARRELPVRATQALQAAIQNRIIRRVLSDTRPLRLNFALRLVDRLAILQGIPARVVGLGFRPEHVLAPLA
jgi:2-polyprenyl-6-methoxyphenol hydroxylase-like FAD-dependent oxidoreductase